MVTTEHYPDCAVEHIIKTIHYLICDGKAEMVTIEHFLVVLSRHNLVVHCLLLISEYTDV